MAGCFQVQSHSLTSSLPTITFHAPAQELPANHSGLEESTENKVTINMTILPRDGAGGSKENGQIVDISQEDF